MFGRFSPKTEGHATSGLLYPYFSMEIKKILIGKVEEETQMSWNQKNKAGYTAQDTPSTRTFHLRK